MNLNNITILLVEDNEINRMLAQNSLLYLNCNVLEAENGLEAVNILKNENEVSLILMDLNMPVMNGIEATQIIRNDLNIEIPIIAMTATIFEEDIKLCFQSGMIDYLVKPFKEVDLYNIIAKYTNLDASSS